MGSFKTALSRNYLHPEIKVSQLKKEKKFILRKSNDDILNINSEGVLLSKTNWFPEFGVSVPNYCIEKNLQFNKSKTTCCLKFYTN